MPTAKQLEKIFNRFSQSPLPEPVIFVENGDPEWHNDFEYVSFTWKRNGRPEIYRRADGWYYNVQPACRQKGGFWIQFLQPRISSWTMMPYIHISEMVGAKFVRNSIKPLDGMKVLSNDAMASPQLI